MGEKGKITGRQNHPLFAFQEVRKEESLIYNPRICCSSLFPVKCVEPTHPIPIFAHGREEKGKGGGHRNI